MLNKDIFKEQLARLSINFKIKLDDETGKLYQKMIYDGLKNEISDENMKSATQYILINVNNKQWEEAYQWNDRRPTLADWINAYKPKPEYRQAPYKCPITGATLWRKELVKEQIKQIEVK